MHTNRFASFAAIASVLILYGCATAPQHSAQSSNPALERALVRAGFQMNTVANVKEYCKAGYCHTVSEWDQLLVERGLARAGYQARAVGDKTVYCKPGAPSGASRPSQGCYTIDQWKQHLLDAHMQSDAAAGLIPQGTMGLGR